MAIGPGFDDPEYDNYDPAWSTQDTPFRRWLVDGLAAAGSDLPAEAVSCFAPANRYHGLSREHAELLAILTGTTVEPVRPREGSVEQPPAT